MKRTGIYLFLFCLASGNLYAEHLNLRNASKLTRGTLPNARLDPSSVTLQGNSVNSSTVAASVNQIINSSGTTFMLLDNSTPTKRGGITLNGQVNNVIISQTSTTVQGNAISIATNAAAINSIVTSSASNLVTLDGSTQTKKGGLTFGGKITVGGAGVTFGDNTTQTTAFSGASGVPSTSGIFLNLQVSTSGTNADLVEIRADFIDVMGNPHVNVSSTCSISKIGIGGLDAGVENENEFYTLFALDNGTTIGFQFSKGSVQSPASPAVGYSKWTKVGEVLNDGSSNITPFFQRGRRITYNPAITLVNTASPATALTRVDSSSYISSSAVTAFFYLNGQDDIDQFKFQFAPFEYVGTITGESSFHILASGDAGVQMSLFNLPVPLFQSRDVKYMIANSPTSAEIRLNGYELGD